MNDVIKASVPKKNSMDSTFSSACTNKIRFQGLEQQSPLSRRSAPLMFDKFLSKNHLLAKKFLLKSIKFIFKPTYGYHCFTIGIGENDLAYVSISLQEFKIINPSILSNLHPSNKKVKDSSKTFFKGAFLYKREIAPHCFSVNFCLKKIAVFFHCFMQIDPLVILILISKPIAFPVN